MIASSLEERLLLALSRTPGTEDFPAGAPRWTLDDALSLLEEVFPDFRTRIAGKDVVDFGCGEGYQSIALARAGARSVVGLEANPRVLESARALAVSAGAQDQVIFAERISDSLRGCFDYAISQNSMEHFPDPAAVLAAMKVALRPTGKLLITFGPPWFAPYGSHMFFFTKVPWVNILFDERTVMKVRSRFRNDGASRYEEVESGLNRMSLGRFEKLVAAAGLRVEFRRYDCSLGLSILGKFPCLRELFVNRISCMLTA
jgi:SAM-dependent methyltransferase